MGSICRLPSMPEDESLLTDIDSMCNSISNSPTDACETNDIESPWCHLQMQRALRKLMRSKYAAPFVDSPSGSSMSLQTIEESFLGGKYVKKVDLFWSDVDACWDTSEDITADIAFMAAKMRERAE